MKLLKKRNLWFSVLTGLAFAAVIYPYNHDMYIAAAFTYVCAIMNLFSAAVFSVLLYFLLEKRFPMDSLGSVVMFLLVQIPGHMLFAAINWGSWACLALVAAWLVYCWISWRRIHPLTRVQKKRRCIAALVLLVLGGCLCGYYSSPVLRVRVFLMQYQDMLEARIEAAGGISTRSKPNSCPIPCRCLAASRGTMFGPEIMTASSFTSLAAALVPRPAIMAAIIPLTMCLFHTAMQRRTLCRRARIIGHGWEKGTTTARPGSYLITGIILKRTFNKIYLRNLLPCATIDPSKEKAGIFYECKANYEDF